MNLGSKIKSRRIELGMSQDELAKKVGYSSRSTINKIELGSRDFPRKQLASFASALEVPIEWLIVELGDDEEFIKNLHFIREKSDIPSKYKAINELLDCIGEEIICVDGQYYLGECGKISIEDADFIFDSAKSAAKFAYDVILKRRMDDLIGR